MLTKNKQGLTTAYMAMLAILLPIHPSIQYILLSLGLPSYAISGAIFVIIFYNSLKKNQWPRRSLIKISSFIALIAWLLFCSIWSPALGQENYFASIRSLTILLPISIFCGYLASQNIEEASRAIYFLGHVALAHYALMLFSGELSLAQQQFTSLSGRDDAQNYQATSFYIGLSAIHFATIFSRSRGVTQLIFAMLLCIAITCMFFIGARASVVAVAITLITLTTTQRRRNSHQNQLIFYTKTITFVSIILILWILMQGNDIANENITVQRFSALLSEDDSSHRILLFSSALEMWLSSAHNFLFGGGLGAFPNYIGASESGWYPHNFFLEILAEGGAIGALIVIWIYKQIFFAIKIGLSASDTSTTYISAITIFSLIAYQFMGGIQTIWMPFLFASTMIFRTASIAKNIRS